MQCCEAAQLFVFESFPCTSGNSVPQNELGGEVSIIDERLNHLRFAIDILRIANYSLEYESGPKREQNERDGEFWHALNQLEGKSCRPEKVNCHVYVGQEVNMRQNFQPEMAYPKAARWRKFYGIIDMLKVSGLRAHLFRVTLLKANTDAKHSYR